MPLATVDFLSGLYNRDSCYADRLSPKELDAIHVSTLVEKALRTWIAEKKDVVLTGNPGDGKTYLLRRLSGEIQKVRGEQILDATAEKDYSAIVNRWKLARKKKRPFFLAINHGPLHSLLRSHAKEEPILREVERQQKSALYYGKNRPETPTDLVVLDLNLRSVLSPTVIGPALDNLLREENFSDCGPYFADESSDGFRNLRALRHPQVRERLVALLSRAAHSGRHISMRDLQGFLSYLLFGGRTHAELAARPSGLDGQYSNQCFTGKGELFAAIQEVFEPLRATSPNVDEDLWEHTGSDDGWAFSRPPLTPDHYPDAWEQFTALKRQYFFEQKNGESLLATGSEEGRSFEKLLTQSRENRQRYLGTVLSAINRFYCADLTDASDYLHLWGAQQYDTHKPNVLVSCYRVERNRFSLETPLAAPWLADALEYRPDHILLGYEQGSDVIGLRIDRGLWRALCLAGLGIPFALRSPQYSQLLQTFMTRLRRAAAKPQALQPAMILSVDTGRRQHVTVDRENGRYLEQ